MALIGEDDIFPPSEITILLQCVFCLKKQKPYEYHAEHIRCHVWDISYSVQVRYSDCLTYTYKTYVSYTKQDNETCEISVPPFKVHSTKIGNNY